MINDGDAAAPRSKNGYETQGMSEDGIKGGAAAAAKEAGAGRKVTAVVVE